MKGGDANELLMGVIKICIVYYDTSAFQLMEHMASGVIGRNALPPAGVECDTRSVSVKILNRNSVVKTALY